MEPGESVWVFGCVRIAIAVLGGGDIHAVNRAGHTLWQLATERGSSKVLAWLQSHTRERVTAGDEVVQGSLLLHQVRPFIAPPLHSRDLQL